MLISSIDVVEGPATGVSFQPEAPVVSIGRADDNTLVLADSSIGEHHVYLHSGVDRVLLELTAVGWHTAIVRGGSRIGVVERAKRHELHDGDRLELGDDQGNVGATLALRFTPEDGSEPQVVAARSSNEWVHHESTQRLAQAVAILSQAEHRILGSSELPEIYAAVLYAALEVVPRATHASLILSDAATVDAGEAASDAAFIPVMSHFRSESGQLMAMGDKQPIARSVFRSVLREKKAILVADAISDELSSESLLGNNIRSTLAVPLWRKDIIIGVLELDNRSRPAMFDKPDLDLVSTIATSAALSISNARLIERLDAVQAQFRQENVFWRQREKSKSNHHMEVIGESDAIKQLMARITKVAQTRATVLIQGETGVGKELVAAAVHARSPRSERLLVVQNCAALPDNLLESELFGHKKGAFTGASEDKKGLFEIADGGSLFLDEVTEIPLSLQAKLLRVLQEGEVRPVGSNRPKQVDVRIIAASNRQFEAEIKAGRFREDLYYRLNVFPLEVPPLRERRADIPLLAQHFLQRYTREFGKFVNGFTEQALSSLLSYPWPGNVRELQNEVQRLVIEAEPNGNIDIQLIGPRLRRNASAESGLVPELPASSGLLKDMLESVERRLIHEALVRNGNNKTSTAKALGITREGLHKKLRQLKLS